MTRHPAHAFFSHQVDGHVWHALLLLLVCELAGCAVLVWPRRTRWSPAAAVALLLAGGYWTRADGTVEGGIMLDITAQHGIVIADMLAVQACLLALAIAARWWVQGRGR